MKRGEGKQKGGVQERSKRELTVMTVHLFTLAAELIFLHSNGNTDVWLKDTASAMILNKEPSPLHRKRHLPFAVGGPLDDLLRAYGVE